MSSIIQPESKVGRVVPNAPWPVVRIKDIADSIQYGLTASAVQSPTGPRFLRITDIQDGRVEWDSVPSCTVSAQDIPKYRLAKGDLVFARTGATTGKSFLIGDCPEAVFASYLIRVRVSQGVDSRFLAAFFQSPDYWSQVEAGKRGIGQPNVNGTVLGEIRMPLPPVSDQRRIVAEIEKQFTRLDTGVAALRRVQANVKRYRAAVLKAACEGRLVPTEAELARKKALFGGSIPAADFDSYSHGSNPPSKRGSILQKARETGSTPAALIAGDTGGVGGSTPSASTAFETSEQLLARILVDRRRNWQGRGSYKEPVAPDTWEFSALPKGWTWASLDQLLSVMRNGISAKPDAEIGLPILRISAVRALSVNLAEIRYLNDKASDYSDYVLTEGDLLFTRYNGNPELVGVCGVVPTLTSPIVHPDKLIRCKLTTSGALPDFVAIMANVGVSRDYLAKRVRTTAGQAGISGGDLKGLPIPLAPLTEQKRIVSEVERRLSVVEKLETAVSADLQRATRLRHSILQQVFTGNMIAHF